MINDTIAPGGLSRRRLLAGLGVGAAATMLAGCTTGAPRAMTSFAPTPPAAPAVSPFHLAAYAPVQDGGFNVPGIDFSRVDPRYLRQEVDYFGGETPGTIIVDTGPRYAYFVLPNQRAIRYGVGIGREGFGWGGRAVMQWKRAWPTWTPPAEMIARDPSLAQYAEGMEPGLGNPLGARALYLFQNGEDTLYRLHGTPEYWTIGTASSSGCVRFINQDIMDLYARVSNGAAVIVNQGAAIA